ncbi:conserved Plasmodium protein, unknown function [Plasmodium ovale wallikeri]|uniref:Uncharacterized protein n=1 Tax=Plasmodium ovale wallikeri TaxID=864142 RepID=A0A1A8Z1L7_PLAOA|nr:conserved Plasmodium protein, unknown function [Plasmodium ovale wallikeri]SBT38367.1 conserved Plasmodium protein, unknown function [Plasmodium ovale wallikeri]
MLPLALITLLMFFLEKYLILCSKKKRPFFIEANQYGHDKTFYISRSKLLKKRNKNSYAIKNEKSVLPHRNRKNASVLCEYIVDTEKKILFSNLFHLDLTDVLNIFKILLILRKITLYKNGNIISIKINEIKKENSAHYDKTIHDYVAFLAKYFSRNKGKVEEDNFQKRFMYPELKKGKKQEKEKKENDRITKHEESYTKICESERTLTSRGGDLLENGHITNYLQDRRKKKNNKKNSKLSSRYTILKRTIKKLYINIKEKCYINNMKDKTILFIFYVNDKKFIISSLYKKIKGIYYLYRNTLYISINNNIKREIAIINLISDNKSYYEKKKNAITVHSFYIKYYVKYHLERLFRPYSELRKNRRTQMDVLSIVRVAQTGGCLDGSNENEKFNFFLSENVPYGCAYCNACRMIEEDTVNDRGTATSGDTAPNGGAITGGIGTTPHGCAESDNVNIKVVNIYMNGKFFMSLPMTLTYNVDRQFFYLNNYPYVDITKYGIMNLCALTDIYFNNFSFFQNKSFRYLNNQNIILNSDKLNFDINYILLFYFLYFNKKEKLCPPEKIKTIFFFNSMLQEKKEKNFKVIKKIVHRADKNIVNFVF